MGIIVDLFAGGGGASTGIEMALGRSPDIAINHDKEALALHRVNHPDTIHMISDVWEVSPSEIVREYGPVDLLWASPDCKHFSKAKGGKPVSKKIRGLAWVVPKWAAKARPRVIKLENVEEFQDWGPINHEGKPCQNRKGQTFRQWVSQLERLGYRVEWRELRASDYDTPTIRKRLFVIARCDDEPIVFPMPSNGRKDSLEVQSGMQKPYRTAAEIIDWTIPCPSIFMGKSDARDLGLKRPLAEATLRRIAKGVMRYVINNPNPFIVTLNHSGSGQRPWGMDEPFRTVTASRDAHALVSPIVTRAQHGGGNRDPKEPLHTICASTKDQNAIIAPIITKFRKGSSGASVEEPLATVTANSYQKRPGGAVPLGVVSAHIMTMRNSQKPHTAADEPVHTVTAGGARLAQVTAFLAQHNAGPRPGAPGREAEEPLSTVTATGSQQAVVAAHMMPHYGASVARDAEEPVGTVTAGGGGKQALVAAHMLNMKGTGPERGGSDIEEPAHTVCAGGTHASVVHAFLMKYYGTDQAPELRDPLHTVSTKDRFGLVTVTIDGEEWVIVDIGMRMLTPRELYRAQGFPESYEIANTLDGPLTKTAQTRMVGNSVCPPLAKALVEANCGFMIEQQEEAA